MSNTKLTHVKTLRNPSYIGSYFLAIDDETFRDLTVKVLDVKKEMVQNGDKSEEETIVHLEGVKPLILNSTNEKSLIALFKTPFIEKWIGRSFTLCVEQIRAFGSAHNALRIRPDLPTAQKQTFGPSHTKWDAAITALKAGNTTLNKLKETRDITPENEQILKKAEEDGKIM